MELSQGQIIQKRNKQELSSLFIIHCLNVMHAPVMLKSYGQDTVCYMELSQGQIIQKPNKQELSSLFMTHRLNVVHAPVKFHNIFHMV